jgi:hypothetical protein
MKRLALSLMCLALLGACESTSGAPPVGSTDLQIEPGRLRTTFRGVSGAGPEEIQDRALLHAANLAVMQGYDWIQVVRRSGDWAPATSPRFTFGVGGGSFGRGGGFGVGASQSVGGEATYVATLEVLFQHGQRPQGPDNYDARDLQASLGPRLNPPPPPVR